MGQRPEEEELGRLFGADILPRHDRHLGLPDCRVSRPIGVVEKGGSVWGGSPMAVPWSVWRLDFFVDFQ